MDEDINSEEDSEFVPGAEEEDPDDFDKSSKKRKVEEVSLLKENELEDLWAQMNGGVSVKKKQDKKEEKIVSNTVSTNIDVEKLLNEVQEVEKPKREVQAVKFAGQNVFVGKKLFFF